LLLGLVAIGGARDAETETTYGNKPALVSEMSQGYAVGAEAEWWAELVLRRVQADGESLDALATPSSVPLQGRTPTPAAGEPGGVVERAGIAEANGESRQLSADDEESGGLRNLICSLSWDCETALRIVQCESNWDPAATNGVSWGLWQINAIHAWRWPDFWESWMIPSRNVEYAYELWQESGWRIWDCR
jgi:hypothetical protein